MKVLFIDPVHPLLQKKLTQLGFVCEEFYGSDKKELESIIHDYSGIVVRSRFVIDKKLLAKAALLKFIARVGAGMEGIDTAYALHRDIVCINAPEGNRVAVGEHAVGMLLCLFNKILQADKEMRQGIRQREANRGIEINGKTIAIIGYGNMGSAFAKCLNGFGADVIAYDKYKKNYSDANVQECTLEEVFQKADVLSLHVPLTDETHYMFDKDFISHFKKDFFLINTARGKVVDTKALVEALKTGKVRGAALDVIEYESASFESYEEKKPQDYEYLCAAPNVVLTPHVAGWTQESNQKMAEVIAHKIESLSLNP